MRGVVEQRQACADCILEVNDVQRGRILIQSIAIAARIESNERAEQQADSRFVGDNENVLGRVLPHDLHQHRQGASRHREPALSSHRRERVRILFPRRGFIRKSLLDFFSCHLFPAPMRNFPQPIARLHFESMRLGQDSRRLDCATQWRCVDRRNLLACQAVRKAPHLLAAFIRKLDVRRAGKAILRGEDGGPMSNEENSGVHVSFTVLSGGLRGGKAKRGMEASSFFSSEGARIKFPRREWSRLEPSDMDVARRVEARERRDQSNQRVKVP